MKTKTNIKNKSNCVYVSKMQCCLLVGSILHKSLCIFTILLAIKHCVLTKPWFPASVSIDTFLSGYKILFFFFPVVLKYSWHITLYKFNVYNIIIWYIYKFWFFLLTFSDVLSLVNPVFYVYTFRLEKCK